MIIPEAAAGKAEKRATVTACNPVQHQCIVCWYGPECGPFYGWQRLDMAREIPCPCGCHRPRVLVAQ